MNISINDLTMKLNDMTACINEIGYKAQVIDPDRF